MQSYTIFNNFFEKFLKLSHTISGRPSAFNLKRLRGVLNGELVLRSIIYKGLFSEIGPKIE